MPLRRNIAPHSTISALGDLADRLKLLSRAQRWEEMPQHINDDVLHTFVTIATQRVLVSLNALYGGRFILGLGVSHIPMVEGVRGHRYEKPLAAMSAYLDGINKSAPAGELPPVVVAALGPKMLALSGPSRVALSHTT